MNLNCLKSVEIPVFIVFCSIMISAPISSNFIIYRTCYVIMEEDESACAQLGLNSTANSTIHLETKVQEVSNYIRITMDMIGLINPCILCIFVGPYSDKKGRRDILIFSLSGTMISSAIDTIIAILPNVSPWYLTIEMLPLVLSGGMPTFITISFCYLIDVTNIDNRTMRIGILEAALASGVISGLFLSSHIYFWFNYVGTFLLSFTMQMFALAYIILFVPESIKIDKTTKVQLFAIEHIKEMWKTVFKQRKSYIRFVLLASIFAVVAVVAAGASETAEALLLRSKFHWDIETITNFTSARAISATIGMWICIYVFYEMMKISECFLIAIGLIFCAIDSGTFVLAEYDWQIYMTLIVLLPVEIITPLIHSLISKITPQDETGKIFSFCIALETFCAIAAGSIYTTVYTLTIDVFPGAFDIIPIVIYIGIIFIFMYIYALMKSSDAAIFAVQEEKSTNIELEKNFQA